MNKKIKVCHITSIHKRYDPRIFEKECRSLVKHGYDVTLLVNDRQGDEIIEGVKILSTGFVPKNRLDRFLNSNKYLYNKARIINADIYHLHDPDLLLLGNKLKKEGKKVIFDSHEDVPNQILDKYWIPANIRNIVSWLYLKIEKRSLVNYDAIISVTPHVVERLKKINKNTIMITNYPIIRTNSSNIKKQRYICFAGGVTEQYNHNLIIDAIDTIEDIKYLLAGPTNEDYIKKLQNLPGWRKVDYKGVIDKEKVLELYDISMIGIAIHTSQQVKKEGSLGIIKFFEFMEAGLPVICTNYTIWENIIKNYNCGICVNPHNVKEIHDEIEYLLNNPDIAKKMGENGRKAVEAEFNWYTQENKLISLYNYL